MAVARQSAAEPYDAGMLGVGDGHEVYWEVCGNPGGTPAVMLHGGPGSGSSPGFRRLFDLSAYRLVQFDQRNCGRSTPHASAPVVDLSTNTTAHLVGDIERLRVSLGIDRWVVCGGSWGSTLGLAYAQAHPARVTAMVLFSVGTTTPAEVGWVTRAMGRIHPEAWVRFCAGVPDADRDADLSAAYNRLLHDPDPGVRAQAARRWCDWEDTHPGGGHDPRFDDPRFRLCFARLVTHYWSNAAFLEDGALLRGVATLGDIPSVLIHGRQDISSPADIAWQLARDWPGAELVLLDDAGHGAGHPAMLDAIVRATTRFAARR